MDDDILKQLYNLKNETDRMRSNHRERGRGNGKGGGSGDGIINELKSIEMFKLFLV